MRRLLLVPLLLLSSSIAAQGVTLRGKVENPLAGQFVVDCSDTSLVSSTVSLNAFVGQHVLLRGTRVPSTGGPLVNVSSIQLTQEIFEIPGNPEVGKEMRFGATFTPGSQVYFLASLQPGFGPAGRAGTLMLDPLGLVHGPTGIIPPVGDLEMAMAVPNIPSLVGRTVYGQAAILTGGRLVLSNPDCKSFR